MAKIQTKISSFKDVQKSLQEVEKQLNNLYKAVNSSAETSVKDSEGKTGDISIVEDNSKRYLFKVKSNKGWTNPAVSRADYDSGWVDVDNDKTTGQHNLGVVPTLVQVQWSGDYGKNVHINWDTLSSKGYDIWLTDTKWQVSSATDYGMYNEGAGGASGWTDIEEQGQFRVLLWK